METIRQLTEREMPLSYALINFAFRREGPANDPLVVCRPEDTWGCFIDGELASNIVIVPLTVFVHGETHGMGLIAGVASWPEHRRGGMIRKLMIRGLEAMRERGQTLSYLGPFHYPFYRKFGYEMMYSYKSYTLKASCLPGWRGKGRVRRMAPDIPLLNGIYEKYALRYNGMLRRDEHRWANVVLKRRPGTIAVYFNEAGEPRGYMIYQLQGNQLRADEFVCLDRDAQHGLWEFIQKHEGAFESVAFTAPADDQFQFLIDNPKGLETKLTNHLMARIVDVPRFLERFRFEPPAAGPSADHGAAPAFLLRIRDEFAPWNDGVFELTVGPDRFGRVRRASGMEASGPDSTASPAARETAAAGGAASARESTPGRDAARPLELSCDIQTLSTMFMGYQRPAFLHELGRLEGDRQAVELLERLIPRRTPYYIDFGY